MRLVSVRSRVRTSLEAVRVGVVGNISACHADAPGSIPGHGVTLFVSCTLRIILLAGISNNFVLFLVTNYRGLINYASIAQLAEHLLRKEKVTSSILVGGWATGSHGLVGYDARLTRERSRVRASVRILRSFLVFVHIFLQSVSGSIHLC